MMAYKTRNGPAPRIKAEEYGAGRMPRCKPRFTRWKLSGVSRANAKPRDSANHSREKKAGWRCSCGSKAACSQLVSSEKAHQAAIARPYCRAALRSLSSSTQTALWSARMTRCPVRCQATQKGSRLTRNLHGFGRTDRSCQQSPGVRCEVEHTVDHYID